MFIFLMHAVVQCPGKEMNWPFAASIKLLLYQHFMIYFICYSCSFFSNTLHPSEYNKLQEDPPAWRASLCPCSTSASAPLPAAPQPILAQRHCWFSTLNTVFGGSRQKEQQTPSGCHYPASRQVCGTDGQLDGGQSWQRDERKTRSQNADFVWKIYMWLKS